MFQIYKVAGKAAELNDDESNYPGQQSGQQPVPALWVGPQAVRRAYEKQKDRQLV